MAHGHSPAIMVPWRRDGMARFDRAAKAEAFRNKAPNPRDTLIFSEDLHNPDTPGS